MATARQHIDKLVISMSDGTILGQIKDLYLDAEMHRLVAVRMGMVGLIRRKALVIPAAAVSVIGDDVWLVSSSDCVVEHASIEGSDTWLQVGSLKGREVQTEGGTRLGALDSVMLTSKGDVLAITLGRTYVQGPLAEKRIILRDAVTGLGSKETPMNVALAQAEAALVEKTEPEEAEPEMTPEPV